MGLLSFDFTARDDGLSKQLKGFREDFKGLGKEILSLQRIQTFLSAISLDKLDQLKGKISEVATSGMKLTSSMEATLQQMDIASRKMGANLGKTGKDLQKFSQANTALAKSLGISVEEAGKANAAFEYLDKTSNNFNEAVSGAFKELGLNTAKDVAKFASAMNIDPYEFTYGLNQMQKQLGLTSGGISQILGSLQQYGTETGDVSGSLKKMMELQDVLAKQKSVFKGDSAAMAKYASGVVNLGLAFQKGGIKDGFEMSKGLAEKLGETGGDFSKLLTGANSDLPGLITSLSKVGLNTDNIFAAMKDGPAAFTAEIAKVTDAAAKQGKDIKPALDAIRNELSNTLGEPFAQELTRTLGDEKTRQAMLGALDPKAMQAVEESGKKALKETKNAFRDSRTAAQLYEEQLEGFEHRFRKLSTISQKEFLENSKKGFDDFGTVIEHVASQKGPMGALVGKMADISKFGLAGLLPADMAAQFNTFGAALENLSGPLAKIKSLGLLNPLGALVGILGILGGRFIKFYAKTKDVGKALEMVGLEVLDFVKNKLPTIVKKGVKYVADAARKLLTGGFSEGASKLGDIGGQIVDAIVDGLKATWQFVIDTAKGLWAGLVGNKGMVDPQNDGQVIGLAIGDMIRTGFIKAKDMVLGYLSDWWSELVTIWSDSSTTVGEKLEKSIVASGGIIVAGLLLALSPLGPALVSALSGLYTVLMSIVGVLGWWLVPILILGALLFGAFRKEGESFGDTMSRVWENVKLAWTAFTDELAMFKPLIIDPLVKGWDQLSETVMDTFGGIAGTMGDGKEASQSFGRAVADVIGGFVSLLAEGVGDLMRHIAWLVWGIKSIGVGFAQLYLDAEAALSNTGAYLSWLLGAAKQRMSETGDFLSNLFSNIASGVANVFDSMVFKVQSAIITAANFIGTNLAKIVDLIQTPFKKILSLISEGLKKFADQISAYPKIASALGIDASVVDGMKKMADSMQNMADSSVEFKPIPAPTPPTPRAMKSLDVYKKLADKPQMVEALQLEGFLTPEDLANAKASTLKAPEPAKAVATEEKKVEAKKKKKGKKAAALAKPEAGLAMPDLTKSLEGVLPEGVKLPELPTSAAPTVPAKAGAAAALTPAAAAKTPAAAATASAALTPAGAATGLPAGLGGAGTKPALPATAAGAPTPTGAAGFGIPAAGATTAATPPPAVSPADISTLVSATNNPAWVVNYITLLRQMHAETLAALNNTSTGAGGGRAPGRPRSISPTSTGTPPLGT